MKGIRNLQNELIFESLIKAGHRAVMLLWAWTLSLSLHSMHTDVSGPLAFWETLHVY